MPFEQMSPVGRLVGGSPITGYQSVNDVTKQKEFNDDGTPKMEYFAMLAIDKANPEWAGLYSQLWNEGRLAFPNLFAPDGSCHRQDFSWKITDGDGRDNNGKLHSEKEGYANTMVLRISSNYPFSCYDTANVQITNPDMVYRGCYVRIAMKVVSNNATGTQKPGIKIYPQGLQLVGHGSRITAGPDAATLFAQPITAGYVPQGMSATPIAGSAPIPGMHAPTPQPMGMQPQQMAPAPQQMAPAPQQMAPAPQQMAPQVAAPMQMAAPQIAPVHQVAAPMSAPAPNTGFVNTAIGGAPQLQMQAPAPTIAPQVVPQYQFTAAGQAQGFTLEQWNAAGHDIPALLAGGILQQVA